MASTLFCREQINIKIMKGTVFLNVFKILNWWSQYCTFTIKHFGMKTFDTYEPIK